jgi:hypothetical protein
MIEIAGALLLRTPVLVFKSGSFRWLDEARPGRPRTIDDDQVATAIKRTLRTQADSVGCIRMRNRDIVELFETVP